MINTWFLVPTLVVGIALGLMIAISNDKSDIGD